MLLIRISKKIRILKIQLALDKILCVSLEMRVQLEKKFSNPWTYKYICICYDEIWH